MIVFGIGTTSSATGNDVVTAILEAERISRQAADSLAAMQRGVLDEPIRRAGETLKRATVFLERETLHARAGECLTHSAASMSAYGVPSVAEAAALAGAGSGSHLIVARQVYRTVTIAIATSSSATPQGRLP